MCGDELVGTGDIECDRDRVDSSQGAEQERLALEHGQRRQRSLVAEAEDRRSVRHDGNRASLPGQRPRARGAVLGQQPADCADAWRVEELEARLAQFHLRFDAELSMQPAMQFDRCVVDFAAVEQSPNFLFVDRDRM